MELRSRNQRSSVWQKNRLSYDDVKEEYMPEYMLPTFMCNRSRQQGIVNLIVTDISTHVEQSRVGSFTGEWILRKLNLTMLQQLDCIGAQRLLEIRRQQF